MHVNITEQNNCYKNSRCDGICSWDVMAFVVVARVRFFFYNPWVFGLVYTHYD
jgi:hypothetical protein